jgi:signal transduction histidine kinase
MRRLLRGTGHDSTWWPVLLLLLIVLVPSAGVVWMMRAAMENERLAVRQRLADAYHTQLEIAQRRVDAAWQQKLDRLEAIASKYPPAQAFAECVRKGIADSVVIIDGSGQVLYPAAAAAIVAPDDPADAAWSRAQQLEFVELKPAEAAEAYQAIAAQATEPAVIARARQAQSRSLFRAGDQHGAMAALRDLREQNSATDAQGRSLAADAELRLLELLDKNSQEWLALVSSLAERLRDYGSPLPSDQRRFLMHALKSLRPGRIIALFKTSTLERTIKGSLAEQPFPAGVAVAVRRPSQAEVAGNELAAVPLAPTMPGWRLSLTLADAASFDTAANERVVFFLWTAVVVVAITAALALLVANMLRRQSRLTRLKNDLVATVSHELKTPLASIRLLVDTLLASDGTAGSPVSDPRQARQYLELIAQENARLSRLIDNFLTFSRMERGKHQFDFQPIDAAQIVDQAVAAVADRFDGTAAKLEVDVERPLPLVGDVDALVRVVVNLLDNAWKYTVEPKRIAVTARRQSATAGAGDQIVIAVADNGIGLSPRALRRVFDRFYQVDQRLSRSQGGCGLGLSIVKYFVEAHGGQVTAESRLREGTVFTVSLPAARMLDDEGSPRDSPNGIEHSPAGFRQQGAAP